MPRVKQQESIDLGIECRSSDFLSSDFFVVHILLGADPVLQFHFFLLLKHFTSGSEFCEKQTGKKKNTVSSLNCFNIRASSRKNLEIDLVVKMN